MRPILSSLLLLVYACEQAYKFNLTGKDVPKIMKYAEEIFIPEMKDCIIGELPEGIGYDDQVEYFNNRIADCMSKIKNTRREILLAASNVSIDVIGTIIDENFMQKLSQFLPEEYVARLERADALLSQAFDILSNKDLKLKLSITEEKLNVPMYVIFLLLLVSNRFYALLDPIDRYPEKLQPSIKKLKEFLDGQVEEEGFRATTKETLDEFEKILAEIKDCC